MAKVALLIGVSEYAAGLNPLPGAVRDVEAMQRVLQHTEMGGFDEVKTLPNPDPIAMQEAIEMLFSGRVRDDLALLFFSGHGVKDDSGRLYFATRLTRKASTGNLVKATAVPASFVQDIMSHSRCKRQVVILDCCFSGAFAEGMTAKDDGTVDVHTQLGGEGRAVLTSSTSTQYSFEQQGASLSVYTRYIVEGIQTGAADADGDGAISIDELHDYARKKVQEAAPAMKPKIYAVEEGFKIRLAIAPVGDPNLRYRKAVERFASGGAISSIGRNTLDLQRNSLGLRPEEAAAIEAEVLKPYQEYKRRLQYYEQILAKEMQRQRYLTPEIRTELKSFQEALGLRDEDVRPIVERTAPQEMPKLVSTKSPTHKFNWTAATGVVGLLLLVGAGSWMVFGASSRQQSQSPQSSPIASTRSTPTRISRTLLPSESGKATSQGDGSDLPDPSRLEQRQPEQPGRTQPITNPVDGRQSQEAEERRQAQETEARRQEAEAKRQAQEAEARRQEEERRQAQEAEARRQEAEAARRQAEAAEARRQAEEAEARRQAQEAEARRQAALQRAFVGSWVNTDPNTRGITRVAIRSSGGTMFVQMWGKCHPKDCNWNEVTTDAADARDGVLSLAWSFSFKVDSQQLTVLPDGKLQVSGTTRFTDKSGRASYSYTHYFIKTSGPSSSVNQDALSDPPVQELIVQKLEKGK